MAAAVQIHDVIDKNEHFHLQSTPCANVWTGAKGSNRITLKLTVKGKKIESKSKELSGEKKRRKLDSESAKKKEDTVDGGENDSEIAEGIPFEEDYRDSIDGESYKCYFEKSICQNIPKHSVIVIDNAPYHSKKYGKLPH